jgi:hypothetical protein
MFKSLTFSVLLALAALGASAQYTNYPNGVPPLEKMAPYAGGASLPMPSYIAKAFAGGTHTISGKPGKNYWENHGRYDIAITVNPPHSTVRGVEHITYFNNSPNKLDSLNMKLIVNSHRRSDPNAGIQVDDFKVNGVAANWNNTTVTETNYMFPLAKPMMPHDSVRLDITWHYLMQQGRGRESIINPTTFYIAYFYPRVSVYDDYKGWDTQPFGAGEFYNDFNDYKLSVTVPKNFVVVATGVLQNPNEVMSPAAAQRYKTSLTSDSTIHIATKQDMIDKTVTAQNENNTWKFVATNITDMAVAASDTYDWDSGSVVTDEKTGRRVNMAAFFDDASVDFHHDVQFGRFSLNFFSNKWPGVQYPFPKSTTVQGAADMEYPMMMNDSHSDDLVFAEMVQDHEQAHTYMPFYMGINESFYAFMDEGWATTFEYLIGIPEKGKKGADDEFKSFRIKRWVQGNHANETSIITPLPQGGNGSNSYGKASMSYLALKDMLGDDLFKKALHTYMDNWHGKHPVPWDYFYSMNTGAGKNLNWFFNNWFFTTSYCDLSLEDAKQVKGGYDLSIKNIGGFAIPFDVVATYTDGTTETFHQTPIVWEKDQKAVTVSIKTGKALKSATLDNGIYMDANEKDNTWTAK